MAELPPPVSTPQTGTGAPPAKPRTSTPLIVTLVIGLALAVVVGLTFLGIALSQQFSSQSDMFTISEAEVAKADNVIELQAHDSAGAAVTGSELAATHDVLVHRLDRAGISYLRVAFNGERIFVILDDDASSDAMARAEGALGGDYRLEVRRVTDAGTCESIPNAVDGAAAGTMVACDRDRVAGYTLGPMELDGSAIVEATAVAESEGLSKEQGLVLVTLDAEGTRAFANLTASLVSQPWPLNGVALVLDGEVLSAPQVMAAITDGNVQIAGGFDRKGAESLAEELRLASQGLTFVVVSTTATS